MGAPTIVGIVMLALSTAAVGQVANKTNTVPTCNNTTDAAGTSSAADVAINNTANNADQTPLGTVPGDPAATTSAPPK